jgi:uncharacterized membrane protein YccC
MKYILGAMGGFLFGLAIYELTRNYLVAFILSVGVWALFLGIVIAINEKK